MRLFRRKPSKKEALNKTVTEGESLGIFDAMYLYTRIIADYITKGRTDNPTDQLEGDQILGERQFYYSVNRIFTRTGVRKPYFLQLPMYVDRGFVTDLRSNIDRAVEAYNQTNQLDENVSVTSIIVGNNYKVDLSKKRMQGRFKVWAKEYERRVEKDANTKLEDVLQSDKHTEETKHKVGSYLYMKDAVEKEKSSFFKTNLIIEVIATSDEILDVAHSQVVSYFYLLNAKAKEVFIQTNEYMKSFSPVADRRDSLIQKMHEGNVFADDTLTSLNVPAHGVIGDDVGVYHGIDILSRRIVTLDMYSGSDANTILLTAKSGEGKSQFAKMLYTFYSAERKYSTVVFDYEGSEYSPLAKVVGAHVISLTGVQGKFINTMVIGDPTGDPEIDKGLKQEARESTVRVFNLLVDEYDGMTSEQLSILSDAMELVYLDAKVTEDPKSWGNSKDITFFHIYMKINDFLNKSNFKEKRDLHGEDLIKNFLVILRPYFEEGGLYKHWFSEPITMQEILDKRHIVFSFGMGSREESMDNSKALALRQLFASHITTLLSNHNVKNNIKTVVFIEEMQRYLRQRFSGEIVAKFTSGGRKNGLVVYLITNSPSELIHMETNVNDNIRENASTILGNVSMYLIGALYKQQMSDLSEVFDLDNARGVLSQLSDIAEDNADSSGLKYCFYMQYKGQAALLRMLSHPALDELPLYKTIDLKDGSGEESLRTVEKMDSETLETRLREAEDIDLRKKNEGASFGEYNQSLSSKQGLWGTDTKVNN